VLSLGATVAEPMVLCPKLKAAIRRPTSSGFGGFIFLCFSRQK
jgi:hypothetical protein